MSGTRWIKVGEKLPKVSKAVLAYDAAGEMVVAWRSPQFDFWEPFPEFHPTHWMPLPDPPKEGEGRIPSARSDSHCKDCKWWPMQYLYGKIQGIPLDGCFACTLPYPDPRTDDQRQCPHCGTGPEFGCVNFEAKATSAVVDGIALNPYEEFPIE